MQPLFCWPKTVYSSPDGAPALAVLGRDYKETTEGGGLVICQS